MDAGFKRRTAKRCNLLIAFSSVFILGMNQPSALSAPVPIGNPGAWVTTGDYPIVGNGALHQGTVEFALPIAFDGSIIDCRVISSSGYKELDDKTCRLMLGRGKFRSAKSARGMGVNGIYKSFFSWGRGPANVFNEADLSLSVNKLPTSDTPYRLVRVDMMIDARGNVTDCAVEKNSNSVGLESLSCQQAMANWKSLPPMVVNGINVPSVQTMIIKFVKRS